MNHSSRLPIIVSAIVALATLLSATSADAAARTASVSGNWSSTATWGGSAVPVAGDTVTINNGITLTVDTTDAACTSLQICSATAGTATLTFAGSGSPMLTVSGSVTVGNSAGSSRIGVITFTSGSTLICGSLTHGATGSQASSINMTAGGTLQVNGAITVSSSGANWTPGAGTVILTATNTLPGSIFSSFNNLTVNGGATTLNINLSLLGNLTVNAGVLDLATATANRSSAGGTLTVADGATLVLGGTVNFPNNFSTVSLGSNSTVTYDNTGAQTISPRAYGNLILTGSGTKSITNASTSVAGNLSIAPTAGASNNISAGLTINVGSLTLGGLGRINGTWGGNTSGANYTNTTYFAATTGKLNVSTDTRTAPTVTTWPTASAIAYGQALSSSTLSGGAAPAGTFVFIDPAFIPTANGIYAAPVRYTPTDTTSYNTSVTNNVNVSVNTKVLTVTGVVAASKVYDKTFAATVDASAGLLVGVVAPDDVILSGAATGTFASSNVANGITVTVSGLTLGGADAAKYTLTQPTTTASITAKSVTVASGLAAVNRLYNGLTPATITSNSVTLSGVIAGDTVIARTNGYAAAFADKHVGTGKSVAVTGLTLGGVSSNNYALTMPTLLANILATNITVTARTNYKVYDGGTTATNTPIITAGTNQLGDTLSFTESYSSPTVGSGNRVLVAAGVMNDGNGGANYNVTFVTFNTGTIAAKGLTVSGVTAADKVYDRTFVATIDTTNAALVGIVPPDDVTLGGTPIGTFVSSNVANNVTVNISGFTLGGANAGNYALTQPSTNADITAKSVTVASGLTGVNRLYNATTTATIASNNVVLAGIVAGDTINARTNGYTASFADKHVGTGKTITISGLTLSGVNSNNYALTQPTLIANILATNITVTARTNYKIYDATTTTTNTPNVTGTIQSGDSASWAQAYATPDAGTNNKVIVPSGSVTDGNGGANYSVTFSNYLTGTIAAKALTLTGVTASDKVYDRTFTATVDTNAAVLVGVIAPDDVSLAGTPVGTFASSNVANNITVNITGLTLGGAEAGNYRLTSPTTTADITAKSAAISSGLAGVTRGYNGTTTATISSNNVVLTGIIAGDTVNARTNGYTAFFADKNVGSGKPLTVAGITLTGTPAGNYSLLQPTNLTANITNRLLIVTANGVNKIYDGTTAATVTLTNDAVSGDVVTQDYTTATFADKNVGTNRAVSVSGISITGGTDAGNYTLSNTTETTTANISVLPVQLAGTRSYDATSNAAAAALTINNNFDGANLALSGNVTLGGDDVGTQAIASAGTITRVRSTTGSVNVGNSISVNLGSSPAAGNTLVAIISTRGTAQGQVTSITSSGATWTRVVQSGASASATSTTEIWYAPNVSASGASITINLANLLRAAAVVTEYNGLLTPTSVDVTNSNYSAGTAGTTATTGTSATTAQANELWVGGIGLVSSTYFLSGLQNSFVEVTNVSSTSGTSGNNARVYALERQSSATGTASSGGTINTSSQWSGAIATFRSPQAPAALGLTGSAATNYTVAGLSGSVSITPKALTVTGLAADNKVYNGDTTATVSGTAALLATEGAGTGTTADGRPYSGDTVSVSGTASAAFADKHVGVAKPVTVTGLTLSGAQAGNYSITQPAGLTAAITALGLTGSITADNKVYDGNASATITARSLTGVIGLDDVSLAGGTATFDNKNVGIGKTVTASGFSLTGADAANYSAPAGASTTADIAARSLTVSAAAQNKAYNGNTTASVLLSDDRVSGDVFVASAASADFDTKDVGTAKPVSVLGIGISGLDAGNYALANTTAASSADITTASLTGHITANNKVYDGDTTAVIASRTLTGVIGAEDVSLIGGTATFDNKNVGAGKTVTATGLSLSGADIANYTLASSGATTTANISTLALAGSVTLTNKIYDGTTNAIIMERAVTGALGGEDVSLTGGVAGYDDKNIGTNKNVTITGLALGGVDAANYSLASDTLTGAADITERPLNVSAFGVNKTYDATTAATVSLLDDRIAGDALTIGYTSAAFADAVVGAAKPVAVSGISVTGVDAANYLLANTETNAVADITAALLTPSITADNKGYDGNNSAAIATRSVTGVIGGEDVSLTGGTATFADKNAGLGKPVTAVGLSLGGADAGNYQLTTTTANTTADIAPALLVASATAVSKVYDGNAATAIATRSLSGVIAPDDVILSGGVASFADKHVGAGKPVTVLGMVLGGADVMNYTLASGDANTTADITARALTVAATAQNKVYDGNADAAVTLSDNRIGGDVLTVGHTAALFDNKNVGIAKPVSVSGISMSGADAGNYALANTTAVSSADITTVALAASATVDNKIYDGTTAAIIASRSLTGVIGADDVTISGGTANFADKRVGNAKPVTVAGLVLGGVDAVNYSLASGDANTTADIAVRTLTVAAAAQNKVYDGNANATVSLSDDRIGGDVLTVNHTAAAFDTKNVGNAKPVSVSGISMSGADAGNYLLASATAASSADITAASLTANAIVDSKVYDGTTAATIASRSLTGVIAPDDVTLSGGAASFTDKNAGNGKAVTVTGLVLGGADVANYTLTSGDANTTADIAPASLVAGAMVDNKVYDGNSSATIATRSLTGVIAPDDVTIFGGAASFSDKHVGNGKPVSVLGMILGGADMANYTLASGDVNTTADITARALTVAAAASSKVYDGNANATVALSDDRINGDVLMVSHTTALFDNKNVGTAKPVSVSGISMTGAEAGNYTLANTTAASSADITAASLTASAIADNKVYDGTTAATIASRSLTGVIAPDDVTISGGAASFGDKHVGNGKPVSVLGMILGGADLANYTLASGDVNTTADITARALTVAAAASSKVYDGNANATVVLSDDRISGDVLTVSHTTALFDNKNVGTAKPVSVSGIGMTGTDAGNYTLANTTAASSADITAAALTVSAVAQNKVYDGNTVATVTLSDDRISGDVLTVSHTTALFDNKNVGVAKSVTVSGISMAGTDAGNYTLANTTAASSADITAASLTVAAAASNKVYDGNANATVALSDDRISGDALTVSHTAASFDNKNVGTTKPVTVSGISMAGTDAGNYTLANTTASSSADITTASLTVAAVAQGKVYDGNANATVSLSDDRIGGDVLTVSHTTALFDNKNVGTAKPVSISGISMTGTDAGNYTLANTTAASSADITAASLTAVATVNNKVYDGLMAATIATRSLTGVIAPDDVTLSGGAASFADKYVGNGKPVTVTGLVLGGADLANYSLASGDVNIAADITARGLNIVATGVNKTYDATNTATVALSDDRISGDVFTASYTNAEFASINVAAGIVVNVSGLAIAGADASNYSLSTDAAMTTADITARLLTVSATAQNKVYDGNTDATVTLSDDHIAGEDVVVSFAAAAFDNKNVGTAKPVTVSGISMSGAGVGNYELAANTAAATADITTVSLVASATADNKIYDGTTAATIASRTLTGVVGLDDVTLTGGTASFADKHAGNAKPVTVTGMVLGGPDAVNYSLASGEANTAADITARPLTVAALAQNKVYDGNADATVSLSDNRMLGDALVVSHAGAAFDNKHVGIAKPVSVSGISLTGADAGDYSLVNTTVLSSADIAGRGLTVSAAAQNKVYDGNADAVVTFSDNRISGDVLTVSHTVALFDNKNVGTAKPVSISGLSLSGVDAANYELAATTTGSSADITAASLTANAIVDSKVYDGNSSATIASRSVTGVIAPDDVTISGGAASFGDKHVGNGKPVVVTGLVLGGADLANYTLASGDVNTTADITARALTVAAAASSKVYDGDANATVALSDDRISGDVLTVSHTTAAFDDKNVGAAKPVSISGISMTGADAGNYTLANTTVASSADITVRSLVVAAAASNKVYDGNANATVALSDNRISGDVLTVSHTTAAFDNKNVGTTKPVGVSGISMAGADAGNYTLANTTAASSADITTASLTVVAAASSKVYDGDANATVALSDDRISGDVLTVSHTTAAFDNKNVGTAKPVSVSGIGMIGADAGNYTLANTTAASSADIMAASLAGSITANSKVYDGNNSATIASRTLTGVVGADDVSLIGGAATFGDKHVGNGKTVTATGLSLSGVDAVNYSLASSSATTTADITAASLTVAAVASNKVYDGNANATVALSDDRISGDVLTVSHTTAAFDNKNVGTAKPVSVSGISMTGADAGNYTLANTAAASSADITARALAVSAIAANKVYDGNADASVTLSDDRISGDGLTVSHAAAAFDNKNAGTAKVVNVSGLSMIGADMGNYTLAATTTTAAADITARALTVTATAQNKVYDGNTNAVVSLADDRISGDVLTAANTDAGFEDANVGVAKVVNILGLSLSGTDAANYSLASLSASTTADITPVQLTVTADNKSRAYGAANPALTATITGFVNSENNGVISGSANLSTLADTNSLVGDYPITAALGTLSATNYTFSFADGTLTITPYALVVSADDQSRTYGAANPTLTGSLVGLQNGDNVTASYATSADTGSGVGSYPITVALADPDGRLVNYSVTTNEGALTVSAATLTVAADNQTRVYGVANPTLTATISGLVNGENASVISGSATVSTTADESSVVASYPITAALGTLSAANYGFSFVDGSLEITAATLMPSITAGSKVYDGTTVATITSRTLTGVVGADDVTLTGGTASFVDENAGTAKTVTATGLGLSGAAANNYVLASTSASTTADITAASLAASATAADKVYDGTAVATIASRTLTGVIGLDDVTLTGGTASFADKQVGEDKTVTITGMMLAGADLANYTLASGDVNTTADITARALTVAAAASSKVYDGNANATVALSDDRISGDVLTVSHTTAAFDNKNVGTAKPVSVSGIGMTGTDAGNYTLANTTAASSADITAASLTVAATASNKVYDGNANATVALSDDRISGDVLTVSHTTALFDNKNVGAAKPVSVSGIGMTGTDAGNYTLANTTAASSADITAASLTASAIADNKVYDGTMAATIAARSLTGVIAPDDVTISGGAASFSDKHVGTGKLVSVLGMILGGADMANYTLASGDVNATADITARALTVAAAASSKVYDGNANATVTLSDDRISGDVLTVSHTTAVFDNKNVGTAKPVSVSGIGMTGTDAGNYTLANTTAASSADITAASLTASAIADNKVYDGTTAATIANRSLTGVIAPDDVTISGGAASFGDKHVGNGKLVSVLGMILGGADMTNYTLASGDVNTTADITARALTVAAAASSKVYDGNANATVALSDDRISGDVLTVSHTTALFDNKNVGTAKPVSVSGIGMTGTDAGNYTLANTTAASSADITAASLTGSITANSKVYDGNTSATMATRTLTGVVGLDDVSLVGGTAMFNNKNVGTSKPVTATGLSLSGADAANYSLVSSSASTAADITAIALTVTADDQSRNYGEANPTLTGTLAGVVAGDNITASYSTTATLASLVGTYDITPALADPDNNLGNYVVTSNNGTLTILGLTPATIGSITQLADGNMHIVVGGVPGQVYHLQAIGDLNGSIWSNLSTNTANGLGVVEFDDLSATNHMSRFYRVSTP